MRRRISAALLCCGVLAGSAGVAHAQSDPAASGERGKALIILDGSKSMNKPAGDGGTRLDAAKEATRELADQIPGDSELGLRVYGSEVAGVDRAQACRDTRLAFPVGPTDRADIGTAVNALRGVGRTPIGRSLLEAPNDLGPSGRRVVVLISDGGDNCAPPDPCEAAEEVARQGVNLMVSVVGLQVSSPRVREQLQCVARAGGGSYVDVDDIEQLSAQVQALFLRGLRTYKPKGKPVTGSTDPKRAPLLESGQYLERLEPGEHRFYAVNVPAGKRLVALPTIIAAGDMEDLAGAVDLGIRHPGVGGDEWPDYLSVSLVQSTGRVNTMAFGNIDTDPITTKVAGTKGAGPPGRYLMDLESRADIPMDVELAVDVDEEGAPIDWKADAPPSRDQNPATRRRADPQSGAHAPVLMGVGAAGSLIGLVAALILIPRRRT